MPKISKRASKAPFSPIRYLAPYAEAAKNRGIKVYHLNIGQPDIETPPLFLNAVKNADITILEYGHSAGNESYRRKLCEYYKRHDINVDPSEIIITCGGSEAISFALMTCFNPGDEILVAEPYYPNYLGMTIYHDIKIIPVKSTIDNGFALPKINEFEAAITLRTKGILVCNPSNPTGYLYSKAEMLALGELAKKFDLFILSDEVYREFCYDGKQHVSAMHLKGLEDNVILLDSISKRYSACGARIGAFITKNKAVVTSAMKFAQTRLSPPTYGQIGAEAVLDISTEYLENIRLEYALRRDYIVDELNKIDGVFCPKPSGAFYCMARLPIDSSTKFCQWLLESFEHNGKTLMLAPGCGFYSSPESAPNQVRAAYVLNREDLKEALICLRAALAVYPGRC